MSKGKYTLQPIHGSTSAPRAFTQSGKQIDGGDYTRASAPFSDYSKQDHLDAWAYYLDAADKAKKLSGAVYKKKAGDYLLQATRHEQLAKATSESSLRGPLPTFESFAAARANESMGLCDIFRDIAETVKTIDPKFTSRGRCTIGFKHNHVPYVIDLQEGWIVLAGNGGSESWDFDEKSVWAIRQTLHADFGAKNESASESAEEKAAQATLDRMEASVDEAHEAEQRRVEAAQATLLQKFKGNKVKGMKMVLPSGKQYTAPQSKGKAVDVDDLAAKFYREGADLIVTPEGKLTWKLDGVTYAPEY